MANTLEILFLGKDQVSPAANSAAQSIARMGGAAENADKKVSGLGALGAKALPLVAGGLVAAGAAAAAFGAMSVKAASDFESSMNVFQAVSGATAEQLAKAGDLATQLGADMSLPATSASDAAAALTELAKAGLSINDAMGAAKGTLQLAAAGMLSEAQAAEITATALNSFGLAGSEAVRVADLLAAGANSSSAEVTDMADSLKMAGSVFATAGVPIENMVTLFGEMANAGIKGSDAGTSLKQMLLALQSPTSAARKIMQELGVNVYDASGKMLDMRSIIGQFSESMAGLTQEQRDAALSTIFGSDAVRAANIVMLGGIENFDKMKAAVTKEGAAATLAAAKTKGLGGAFSGLQSQFETLLLVAGKPFLPLLEQGVRGLADVVGSPQVQSGIKIFAEGIASAAASVASLIGQLGGIDFGQLFAGITNAASQTPTGNFLGGILDGLKTNFDALVQWISGELAPALSQAFGTIAEAALPTLQKFGGYLNTYVLPALQQLGALIGPVLQRGFALLGQFITTQLIPAFTQFAVWIFSTGLPALGEFAMFIGGEFNEAVVIAKQIWDSLNVGLANTVAFIDGIVSGFENIIGAIASASEAMLSFINSVIVPLAQAIAGLLVKIHELLEAIRRIPASLPLIGGGGGNTNAGGSAGPGFAAGGSFVVPRGFPNDSFPMRVSSGEHVQVTPASQTRGAGGDIYISIDGSPFQKVKDRRVRMRAMLGAI